MSSQLSNEDLEASLVQLARRKGCDGVILILVHPEKRAEYLAGLTTECRPEGVPRILRAVAAAIEDGDGMPMGGDMKVL